MKVKVDTQADPPTEYAKPDINDLILTDDEPSNETTPGSGDSSTEVGDGEEQQPESDADASDATEDGTESEDETGTDEGEETEQSSEGDESEEGTDEGEDSSEADEQATLKRDYSDFDEEDQVALRKLPNKAFNSYKQRLRDLYAIRDERNTLQKRVTEIESGALPPSYHDHPQGFLLSPEYNQLSQQYNTTSTIADHWQQQLANIKAGSQWQTLQADKDGNPTIGASYDASPQAEAQVTAMLTKSQTAMDGIQSRAQDISKQFSTRHKQSTEYITKVTAEYVKKLPEEIRPNDGDVAALQKLLPEEYRDHPLAKLAGSIFGIARRQDEQLKEQKTKVVRKAKLKSDQRRAGPKSSRGKAAPPENEEMIDMDSLRKDFEGVKFGY